MSVKSPASASEPIAPQKWSSVCWRGALLRSIRLALLLLFACLLAFVLLSLSPLDPLIHYLGGNLLAVSDTQRTQMIRELGLDTGLWQQITSYFSALLSGDMGQSLVFRQSVSEVIAERLPLSLLLMALSWGLALLLGYGLGLLCAITEGSFCDRWLRRFAWLLSSIPSFWLAMIMISLFSVTLAWTPVCCAAPLGLSFTEQSLGSMLLHLALPLTVLTLSQLSPLVLHTREKVLDLYHSEYVGYAQSHGKGRLAIFKKHIFANSLKPAIVLHFASFAELFGGSILAETVFNFPGLGSALVKAGLGNDAPLLMGITLFSALFVFCGNLAAELISARLQRGRLSGGSTHAAGVQA
ncbi:MULTISPECIES: ABC transporter permease [Shewanella]|uniref:ABC transporter permease n=1 Tax=Shewanella TaxID=22 RepID=UPI000D1A77B4|nr:ABC transporter permease [Shewanella algae]EKT4486763.1 ABC transporter permease [Shewanella algae]MBO2547971.1 ABC transporter permease [Shewanella algae]MBO2612196.1 ABC transporter permease [Shewanella algae]MCE9778289.1 ABC transporter permease [Shewanella algae]MCE9826344.1 ABC transporter permease [Shewanella algae]